MKPEILGQYKASDGDIVTRMKVGSSFVTQVDVNLKADRSSVEKSEMIVSSNKPTKQERVNRIKVLIGEGRTRTECKDILYKEQVYFGNPNPASAFAGDWNSIQ